MKYKDIKKLMQVMVEKYTRQGKTENQAEEHILNVMMKMFKDDRVGFMDMKYVVQILGYEPNDELSKIFADLKKAVRQEYGINDLIRGAMKSGKSKMEANLSVIAFLYDGYQKGYIEEPELLDMGLWSIGYRLKEEFLLKPNKKARWDNICEPDE